MKLKRKKVIIIGAGFGGLAAAKSLKNSNVDILLIDKTNHHLFQPLLYQVATAALSPGDIAAPIRGILRKQKNVTVIMGEVTEIDKTNNKVIMSNEEAFEFDYLILAPGTRHSYFGNNSWEKYAPGLKTISDALTIRERILLSFEKAERINNPEEIHKYLTFVIVGGGPTGVELAGAIAEITKKTMLKDFRKINPLKTKIFLVEGGKKLLNTYDQPLNDYTKQSLQKLGVKVILNKMVNAINENGVQIGDKFVETKNVIWAAGNKASSLLLSLNVPLDNAGRVYVEKDCSIQESKSIFVIGDAANFKDAIGNPLPGVAPVAVQQGKFVANIIKRDLPEGSRPIFKYIDKGSMATIGRSLAIMQVKQFKLKGLAAWLMWSLVHVAFLINYRERYKVMTEWIWYYLTYRHGIRLITHKTDI
jgi:NADH dehydrogenase